MRVAFLTLGCKVNSYETEQMKSEIERAGHKVVAFHDQADIYIVNTCTVTNIADRKSRQMLHRARRQNPDGIVVAVGCYVDSARQKNEKDDSVDLFLSNGEKERLIEYLEEAFLKKIDSKPSTAITETNTEYSSSHTRAYIKVQNGCNQYCSYCIIPYVRGSLSFREQQDVIREIEELAERGYREVVVTGIHLSSYGVSGKDAGEFVRKKGKSLLELLRAISQVEGIERIRMGSLEPRIITEYFARELADIPKICPHFHLSLQSGCDATLKRMNRHYTREEYMEGVEILRRCFQHPAITTDIIVGFPQETEEEFAATCEFVRHVGFAQIHVFKYSRRQGTAADRMEGQISETEKHLRSEALIQIEKELEEKYQAFFAGQEEEVLFEEITEIQGRKYLVGYNERYVRIGINVEGDLSAQSRCNTIGIVRILGHVNREILMGEFS